MKIHILMSCYNRKAMTIAALSGVRDAVDAANTTWSATLVDDASTDGTAGAIAAQFPEVSILTGTGTWFWARSMAEAETAALATHDDVTLIWLNDDVRLDADWLARLDEAIASHPGTILVGSMRERPDSEIISYAGFARTGLHPLRLKKVLPTDEYVPLDAFNGNFVAVPDTVARRIGGIDGAFSHALADIDYGYRANKAGIKVLLMPGAIGSCARNTPPPSSSWLIAWRSFIGPKGGGNFSSMLRMHRRHAPLLWPLTIGLTYIVWAVRSVRYWPRA